MSEALSFSPPIEQSQNSTKLPRLGFCVRFGIATLAAGAATLLLPPDIPQMIFEEAPKIADALPKAGELFLVGVTQRFPWSLGASVGGGLLSDMISDIRKKPEERTFSPVIALGSGLAVTLVNGLSEVAG